MRIWFAGPLFCEAERVFNLRLAENLEAKGYQVFLAHRDGVESEKPPSNKTPNDELQKKIFELDRDRLHQADIFLFVLDGRVPDEGACVELLRFDKPLSSMPYSSACGRKARMPRLMNELRVD